MMIPTFLIVRLLKQKMKTHGTPRPAYGMPLDAVRPDGRQIHSPGPRGAPLQNRQAPENGSLVAIQHSTRGARVSRKRGVFV